MSYEYCCIINNLRTCELCNGKIDSDGHDCENRRYKPQKIVPETSEGQLKPCPFCGGKAKADYCDLVRYGSASLHWYVYCKSCQTKTKRFMGRDNYKKAIAAWNRRSNGILEPAKKLINGVPVEMIIHE